MPQDDASLPLLAIKRQDRPSTASTMPMRGHDQEMSFVNSPSPAFRSRRPFLTSNQ